jgi:hypothetical protein
MISSKMGIKEIGSFLKKACKGTSTKYTQDPKIMNNPATKDSGVSNSIDQQRKSAEQRWKENQRIYNIYAPEHLRENWEERTPLVEGKTRVRFRTCYRACCAASVFR